MAALTNIVAAQEAVLGSALLTEQCAREVLARTTAEMYDEVHRPVYEAITALMMRGSPIDPVTVRGELGEDYGAFIMQLMDVTPTAANCGAYIRQLRDLRRLEQARGLGEALQDAPNLEAAGTLLEKLTTLLTVQQRVRAYTFQRLMDGFLEAHAQRPDYLRWGLPVLDDVLSVRPGSFVILGGYPSAGKTALALQFVLAQSAPPSPRRIGFFSYETDEGKIRDRSVAHAAGYALGDILNTPAEQMDYSQLAPTLGELSERQVTVILANGMNVAQIYSLSLAHRFDVVYIDYIQLIRRNPKLMGHEAVAEISRQLQGFAHATGITVVGLSQFSRQERAAQPVRKSQKINIGGEDILLPPRLIPVREPTMSDLRESGQLEQDADAILLLWRPYPDSDEITDRVLKIAKNKDGAAGMRLTLRFDGPLQRFTPEHRESLMERVRQAAGHRRQEPEPEPNRPEQTTLEEPTEQDDELPF